MALVVAVVASVVALGAILYALVISRRVGDVEADTRARGEQESRQWNASMDGLRAEQASRLTDLASSLGKHSHVMDRRSNDLQKQGEAIRAQAASAVEALAGQIGEVGERTREDLAQVHADMTAHKESTIGEVVDLLRHQTDSLRNDLVARLAGREPSE
jgi:formate dehydrogenase maturation protein FdhE